MSRFVRFTVSPSKVWAFSFGMGLLVIPLPSVASPYRCEGRPKFLAQHSMKKPALSTTHRMHVGIVLADMATPGRIYQHPSWSEFGRLGPIVTVENGDVFVAPVPNVSVYENPFDRQNTVLRLSSETGVLEPFIDLPVEAKPSVENPFGVVGLTYSCANQVLYAATLSGSTQKERRGKIVAISLVTGKVLSELPQVDAIGMAVFHGGEAPELLYGSARESALYSVKLSDSGAFIGQPNLLFTFDRFGTQRARKVTISGSGELRIDGTEFYYSLLTAFEIEQEVYRYRFNRQAGVWEKM